MTADLSIGDIASGTVSNLTGGGVQTKGNLIGQLTDPRTVTVSVSPATIDEGGTRQLTLLATMDDATTLNLTGLTLWTFGVPISTIDAVNAVATAGSVFANTPRQVTATFQGVSGDLTLTVLNANPDNYFAYAADGLYDDWQVLHLGPPPNANAAPTVDADGDGRNNRTEFLSGFSPTDPASFLEFIFQGFSSGNVMDFRLNKVIPGRTYTVKANTDLTTTPTPVGSPLSVVSEQTNQLFQDPAANGRRKCYCLEISKP